jgi:hypothetical protein
MEVRGVVAGVRVWGGILAALFAAGCAAPPRQLVDDPFDGTAARAETIRLDVENRNSQDATIYVMGNGSSARRVGDVPGNGGTRSFQVRWDFAADMTIRIDLIAGGSCVTAPLAVGPGETIGLQIDPIFSQTYCR